MAGGRAWLAALAVGLLATACSSSGEAGGSGETLPTPPVETTSSTTTQAPTSAPSTTTATADCTPADPADVEVIEAALTGDGADRLGEAFTATNGSYRYIGANVYGQRHAVSHSSEVWLIEGPTIYALTTDAQELTGFPDGRDLTGPDGALVSAGDETGTAVQACVQGA